MERILAFATNHPEWALLFFCLLILLAGLNIPISEDVILLSAGGLASMNPSQPFFFNYLCLFFACWIAAWEAYWIGRLFGPALYRIRWFSWLLTPEKVQRLHYYYEKFGVLTFFIGRFIPGGVRNCLFMSSGLGKMPFTTFILRDLPGCLLSSAFLFYIGFLFGQNMEVLLSTFKTYSSIIFIAIALLATLIIYYKYTYRDQGDLKEEK